MKVLVGGAGSSGSTMLRVMLSRNREIFSGTELNFFNKERLFTSWMKYRKQLLSSPKTFSTDGWFPYPGHNLLHSDYGWCMEEITDLVDKSRDVDDFSTSFFARPLDKTGASVWVEKTPSNAYCFKHFISLSDQHRVIHIVRNPYDSIASLVRRGMSVYFAAGLWIYNNAAALSASDSNQYLRIKYEDLVVYPEAEFNRLYTFLGVGAEQADSLESINETGKTTWANSPNDSISTSSVGGFLRMNQGERSEIIEALYRFRVRENIGKRKMMQYRSAEPICDLLGYQFLRPVARHMMTLTGSLMQDWARRTVQGYSTGLNRYPATIYLGNP